MLTGFLTGSAAKEEPVASETNIRVALKDFIDDHRPRIENIS
jgi:hypothetical protein